MYSVIKSEKQNNFNPGGYKMLENVIRTQKFNPMRNCYETIVTDHDEYQMTHAHRYLYRRCSDNVIGRILTHAAGIEFIKN